MSLAELLVVVIVALVVFGPEKLPKIAYELGKLKAKLQTFTTEFNQTMEKHVALERHKEMAKEADKHYQSENDTDKEP